MLKAYELINNKILNGKVSEYPQFVTDFCVFNNALKNFLTDTDKIIALKSLSIYHRFIDFETEIFQYSSAIVKKEFSHFMMDQTTSEEITLLQKYVVEFGYWLSHFEFNIASLRYYYENDINKMEDRSM